MEGKGDNIIRVSNISGATIKVFISEIERCTWGIKKSGEKSPIRRT
jgi:phenylpyruvate tautomerase PptA (4-oxalocrotonate tautomerase family)